MSPVEEDESTTPVEELSKPEEVSEVEDAGPVLASTLLLSPVDIAPVLLSPVETSPALLLWSPADELSTGAVEETCSADDDSAVGLAAVDDSPAVDALLVDASAVERSAVEEASEPLEASIAVEESAAPVESTVENTS